MLAAVDWTSTRESITACVALCGMPAARGSQEIRRFGDDDPRPVGVSGLAAEPQVTHVAMESTGVYWKPVWNILEGQFAVVLVNAQHIKAVPGRKTDTKDCQWIAELSSMG